MEIKAPRVADVSPVNSATFAADAELNRSRFEYLAERRDQLLDKLRFGFLALNGASLLALISALGGDGHAAAWIGINPPRARWCAAAWVLGVVLAGVSSWLEGERYRAEASDAFRRQVAARHLASLHNGLANQDTLLKIEEAMKEYFELPLVDFQYSGLAIALQNASGAIWLAGICVPLFAVVGWW